MISCAHCKAKLTNSQKFCNTCGTPAMAAPSKEARTACRHCGHTLPARQHFCSKCGTPVAASTNIDKVDVESSLPRARTPVASSATHHGPESPPVKTHPTDLPDVKAVSANAIANTQHDGNDNVTGASAAPDDVAGKHSAPAQLNASHPAAAANQHGDAASDTDGQITLKALTQFAPTESGPSSQPSSCTGTALAPNTPWRRTVAIASVTIVAACVCGALWWHKHHAASTQAPVAASTISDSSMNASGAVASELAAANTPTSNAASLGTATSDTAVATTAAPATMLSNTLANAPASASAETAAASTPTTADPAPAARVAQSQSAATAPAEPPVVAAVPPKPRRAPERKSNATAPPASAISGLLRRANGDLSCGQYDKAIATAESVLMLDPGNGQAKGLVARAKAQQMEALRNSSSLE